MNMTQADAWTRAVRHIGGLYSAVMQAQGTLDGQREIAVNGYTVYVNIDQGYIMLDLGERNGGGLNMDARVNEE